MQSKGFLFITFTFIMALLVSLIPFPAWAIWLTPAWVAVLLIYWTITLPHQIGLGIAWILGILLDVLNGTLLGEHAIALILVSYLCLKLYRQLRMFPIWQQAVSVALLIALYQFILFWIQGLIGQVVDARLFWLPILTSALLWPLFLILLRGWRRQF